MSDFKTMVICLALAVPLYAAGEGAPAAGTPTAAEGAWKENAVTSLNLSQNHYANWAAGGQDSLSWIANLNAGAGRDDAAGAWDSNVKLAYGQNQQGSESARKVADAIHGDSTYTLKLNAWVNPFAGATWDTQFDTGYKYFNGNSPAPLAVSKFMDPGYLAESLGLAMGAGDWFKLRAGAAAKQTFSHEFGAYTVDQEHPSGQACRSEYGASAMAALKLALGQQLLFTSQVDAFSNLRASDQITATWANQLSAKVNSWMAANVTADVLYDRAQSTAGQFREGLSLTLSYNLL